jgi:hypothetical protein
MLEEGVVVTGRQGKRCQHLLDDIRETRRCWILEQQELDHILCRTSCARGYGLVARQTTRRWCVTATTSQIRHSQSVEGVGFLMCKYRGA